MRRTYILKNSVKKKSIFLIIVLVLLAIISALGFKNKLKAAQNPEYDISVLEIQPGKRFRLTKTLEENKLVPREEIIIGKDGERVKVTHISMAEYISMVDEISGKYDCLVVGRENKGLLSEFKLGEHGDKGKYDYRDYTDPFSQRQKEEIDMFKGDYENGVEYYSENDITSKRSKEIIKMIESGQLVYMDEKIDSDTYWEKLTNDWEKIEHKSIKKTKLWGLYNEQRGKFKGYSETNNISIDKITGDYKALNEANKRPVITNIIEPTSDKDGIADIKNRKMEFKFSVDNPQNEDLIIKLFLDTNGDGLFKENEFETQVKIDKSRNQNFDQYRMEYNLDEEFIGYLGWKVEVCKKSKARTDIISSNTFVSTKEANNINVLQIYPNSWDKGVLTNEEFKNIINDGNFKKNYNIKINGMGSTAFNKGVGDKTVKLNGNYDMVIIGFADIYANGDFTPEAIQELEGFMKTGQSIMFTHDTIAKSLASANQNEGPRDLTRAFRDIVGQARFKDPYRRTAENTIDESDLDGGNIPHMDLNDPSKISAGISLGYGNRFENLVSVRSVNNSQMTDYPFSINGGDNNKVITVGKTHQQWYQLNLEDEDLVPWFNMVNDGVIDSGDSRNFYYTYSKGNITYSGTGDGNSNNDCSVDEYKLFANTIVKADKSANHAPDILCSIPKESTKGQVVDVTNEIPAGVDYKFNIGAKDLEKDLVAMKATIDGKELSAENVDMSKLKDKDGKKIFEVITSDENREQLEIKIPKEKIATIGKSVTVEIEATDEKGAKSNKKYVLKAIEAPNFEIRAELDVKNLTKVDDSGIPIKSDVEDNIIKVRKSDKVKVKYDIIPKDLNYGTNQESEQKEIVVLIDETISKSDWGECEKALNKDFFKRFKGSSGDKNIYGNVIVYGDGVKELSCDTTNTFEDQMYLKTSDVKNNLNPKATNRNLGKAIETGMNFFTKNKLPESSKNILIISNDKASDTNTIEGLSKLVEENYNVLTLSLNDDEAVKLAHKNTGGIEADYYRSNSNTIGENMDKINKRMEAMRYKTYLLKNVNANFDLGSEIVSVEGLTSKNNSTEKYYKELPRIKYTIKLDDKGKPLIKDNKLIYEGSPIVFTSSGALENYNMDFIIRSNSKDLCKFKSDNEVSYDYGRGMTGRTNIEKTPILKVQSVELDHGVYRIIFEGKANYLKEDSYQENSVVTFAANITEMGDTIDLELFIDKDTSIVKEPIIYAVNSNNEATLLNDMSFEKKNNHNYELKNFPGDKLEKIIVVYSLRLNSTDDSYINTIAASGESRDVKVYPIKNSIPELF